LAFAFYKSKQNLFTAVFSGEEGLSLMPRRALTFYKSKQNPFSAGFSGEEGLSRLRSTPHLLCTRLARKTLYNSKQKSFRRSP